jgi:DNA-binding Lrp family transcriptional regulator
LAIVRPPERGVITVSHAAGEPRVIFVQFKCKLGMAYEVAARLVDEIENTPQVYSTSGQFDLIARFHLDALQDPGLFVTEVLQRIEGVAETHTIIGFNAFTPRHKPGA